MVETEELPLGADAQCSSLMPATVLLALEPQRAFAVEETGPLSFEILSINLRGQDGLRG